MRFVKTYKILDDSKIIVDDNNLNPEVSQSSVDGDSTNDLVVKIQRYDLSGNPRITWIEGINLTGKSTFAKTAGADELYDNFYIIESADIKDFKDKENPYVLRFNEILGNIEANPNENFVLVRSPLSAIAYGNSEYVDPFTLDSKFKPSRIYLFTVDDVEKHINYFKDRNLRTLDSEDLDIELNKLAQSRYIELLDRMLLSQ